MTEHEARTVKNWWKRRAKGLNKRRGEVMSTISTPDSQLINTLVTNMLMDSGSYGAKIYDHAQKSCRDMKLCPAPECFKKMATQEGTALTLCALAGALTAANERQEESEQEWLFAKLEARALDDALKHNPQRILETVMAHTAANEGLNKPAGLETCEK
jgi:hypothetical protein